MAVTHPPISRWEYEALQANSGWTVPLEYLEGQAVVVPPVGDEHGCSCAEVMVAIRDWQRSTGDRGRTGIETFVLIGEDTCAPDLSYWREGRRTEVVRGRVPMAPDLVVEIASPSTQANDLVPKRRAYVNGGVREQWLIDPVRREAIVVDTEDRSRTLAAGDRLVSAVLPGFSARVAALIDPRS